MICGPRIITVDPTSESLLGMPARFKSTIRCGRLTEGNELVKTSILYYPSFDKIDNVNDDIA